MTLNTWLGLSICNLIWSVHPIMGKWLLEELTPAQGAWLRYMSAFLGYLLISVGLKIREVSAERLVLKGKERYPTPHTTHQKIFLIPQSQKDWILTLLLGFLPFCFSPLIQMTGLSQSLASENAIIIAMEPLMTAFMAWALLRETMPLFDAAAFILALMGFFLLAGVTPQIFKSDIGSHGAGNFLILISLMGEASYTILARKLTGRYSPLGVFGTSLAAGCFFLTVTSFYFMGFSLIPDFHHFTWKTVLALIWLGPLGTAGCYLYLMFVLVQVPVLSVTLFLFLQPLVGAVLSYLLLGDRLSPLQTFGGGLILFAVLTPNAWRLRNRPSH